MVQVEEFTNEDSQAGIIRESPRRDTADAVKQRLSKYMHVNKLGSVDRQKISSYFEELQKLHDLELENI